MIKTVINLKTLTPLFLHGAETTDAPELRAPSIRGLMRYWFRAAMGGVIGDKNLNGLRMLESELFGDTEKSGAISIRINSPKIEKISKVPLLPHKNTPNRFAITDAEFKIILSGGQFVRESVWKAGIDSLLLAANLGGFGQRARRGYGDLEIEDVDKPNLDNYKFSLDNIEKCLPEFLKTIQKDFKILAADFKIPITGFSSEIPSFPCFSKETRFWVSKENDRQIVISDFMNRIPKTPLLGGIQPRHASPLWVRPIKKNESQWALLMTYLPSKTCCPKDEQSPKEVAEILEKYGIREIPFQGWDQ